MFNPSQPAAPAPVSSQTLPNPLPHLAPGTSGAATPFMATTTLASPTLHASYLTTPTFSTMGTGAADVDMLVDQPTAVADDIMMTDDRILADDDPMLGGGHAGLEPESEMMIDEHDHGGPGAATPMSVTMVGDVDVDMVVASDVAYDVGAPIQSPVAEVPQRPALDPQLVQPHEFSAVSGRSAPPSPVAASHVAVPVPHSGALAQVPHPDDPFGVELQEQPFAQVQDEAVVANETVLILAPEPLVKGAEHLANSEETTQPGTVAAQPHLSPPPVAGSPLRSTAGASLDAVPVVPPASAADIATTAQSSPHSHPQDPNEGHYDEDDDEAQGDVAEDGDDYYDPEDDGEMPHVTLAFNGVTYSVFPPLASEDQRDTSSSPSSPSLPPLFPTADESELVSIRHGTVNDFMWRVKERFDLNEDMDVSLKYMSLDGIVIREETSIGYDNQFDSFWSLYIALYPDATEPLRLEVTAELSAAAKLDMLLYRAQYLDESVAEAESASSSPSPPIPADAGVGAQQALVTNDTLPSAEGTKEIVSEQEFPDQPQQAATEGDFHHELGGQLEEDFDVDGSDLGYIEPASTQVAAGPASSVAISDSEHQLEGQQQLVEPNDGDTRQDDEYVDEHQDEHEGHVELAQGDYAEEEQADEAEVQAVCDYEYAQSEQAPQPGLEQAIGDSSHMASPQFTAVHDPHIYAPTSSDAPSTSVPEDPRSIPQHEYSEELLDWEDDSVSDVETAGQVAFNGVSDEVAEAQESTSSPSSIVSRDDPSHITVASGIPPSPAPTVEPHHPATSSASVSRPSSPVADSAAEMAGDLLFAGETAPVATNGAMKRSLEMVGDNDFGQSTESDTGTANKRQRTTENLE